MTATTYSPAIPPPATTVGGRIAQARSYSRISQARLIQRIGCDRKTLSSWENDHTSPTVEQLLLIAHALGFPASWFLDGLEPATSGSTFGWLTPSAAYGQSHVTGGETCGGDQLALDMEAA